MKIELRYHPPYRMVIMIIGEHFCPIPDSSRTFWFKCEKNKNVTDNVYFLKKYLDQQTEIDDELKKEQKTYQDIVLLEDVIDVYHNLSRKELRGFNFVQENFKSLKWLVKLDDDVYQACRRYNTTQ